MNVLNFALRAAALYTDANVTTLQGADAVLFRYGYDVSDVVTRLTFQEGVQGTLEFAPAPDSFFDAPAWAPDNPRASIIGLAQSDLLIFSRRIDQAPSL